MGVMETGGTARMLLVSIAFDAAKFALLREELEKFQF